MAELGGLVNITALFPIMNATDNLAAVADLIESRPKTRNSYTASLLTLCRAAVEAAAKTIWLLCEPDRTVRRARCIGFTDSELAAQRGFHAVERRRIQTQPDRDRDPNCLKFLKHVELFEQRIGMMGGHKREKAPSFSGFVAKAGKWVDEHAPAHDDGELCGNGFELGVSRFYIVGSGFVHGYKWAMDYVQTGELETFRMVADGLGAAVGMVECAVALYEAQAQRHGAATGRQRIYPDRIEPTIIDWSALYA